MTPIELQFDVACPPTRAFQLWTERIDLWWPPGKSFHGGQVAVTFEPVPGGRIFETQPDGTQQDWGRVQEVKPPHRLRYTWHLMFDPQEATDVEVTFSPNGDGTTVRLVHGGWERLQRGVAEERRRRNRAGWTAVAEVFSAAAADA